MTPAPSLTALADQYRTVRDAAFAAAPVTRSGPFDHSAAGFAYHPLKQLNHLGTIVNRALRRAAVPARPIEIQLNNIGFCNLRCPQCPTHGTEERHALYQSKAFTMPRAAIEAAVAESFAHIQKVATSGLGEGLLHRDYDAIVAGASRYGVKMFTNSNGTTLLPKRLRGLFGVSELRLSLDGATPVSFEAIRRGAKFAKVMRNVLVLTRANEVLPPELRLLGTINFGICASNARDMPLMVDLCAHLGLGVLFGFHMDMGYNPRFAADDIQRYPKYYKHFYLQAMQRARARHIQVGFPPPAADIEPDAHAGPPPDAELIVDRLDDSYYLRLPSYERLIDTADIEPEVEAMARTALESAIERHAAATPERVRASVDEAQALHDELSAALQGTLSALPPAEALRLQRMHASDREVNDCQYLLQYLNYQPDGAVFPCCQADIEPVGESATSSLDILRGPAMATLLDEFSTGRFRPICQTCVWNKRQRERDLFPIKLN